MEDGDPRSSAIPRSRCQLHRLTVYITMMAKQSSLADFHKSNGAIFSECDGWLLPSHFGNPAAEYSAVRSTCGFIDLSHRGLLQLTGPDRLSFLQGLLSNDLK